MPRDSNGNYSLPASVNPVVSGTTITSNWANTTLVDIAQGITDSLDRSGRGGMLAPFRLADGSVALPGLAFTNETSTGISRPSAGRMSFSVTGTEVLRATATALSAFFPLTTTAGMASAVISLSGNAAQWTAFSVGRTAVEGYFGISGGASHLATGDVAGDIVLRNNNGRILFAVGGATPAAYLTATGLGINVLPTSPIHALLTANSVYSAVDMVASGVVSNLRNATTTNGTAAVLRFDVNGSASSAVAAIACVHMGDGASALAFGTRPNAAGNIIERVRIDNTGSSAFNATPVATVPVRIQAAGFNDAGVEVQRTSATEMALLAYNRNGAVYTDLRLISNVTRLYTGGTNLSATVDAAGRVGIARVPASHIFEVAGTTALGHTTADMLRLTHDTAFLSFYNTAASVRSGYIQMNSGGNASIVVESANSLSLGTNSVTRLQLDGVGRAFFPAIHNNASGAAGTSPLLASGTYTPTGTTVTNASSAVAGKAQWSRTGNVVTVSGNVTITASAAGPTSAKYTLPIGATFTADTDLGGNGTSAAFVITYVASNASDRTQAFFNYNAAGAVSSTISYTYTYEVK